VSGVVVVGYIPTPEGIAAFEKAKDEVVIDGSTLVVVNTGQSGNFAAPTFASPADIDAIDVELTGAGIAHEVVQSTDAPTSSRCSTVATRGRSWAEVRRWSHQVTA
jgi:hypothetical protein